MSPDTPSGAATARSEFLVWRIVGNDLPPRHDRGTTLANLRFTLEHEPELPRCEKRWRVNRIVDPSVERAIVETLERHGATYDVARFDPEAYRAETVRYEKIRCAIDINGARNDVLARGRRRARYTLPLDAGNFFSRRAWDALVATIAGYEARGEPRRYFSVPMMRLRSTDQALDPSLEPDARDEPQLVFRDDATLEFDPRYRYGHRDKLELLRRLGKIPGFLRGDRRDPHRYTDNETVCPDAGWVLRLASESPAAGSDEDRHPRREEALDAFVRALDATVGARPDGEWTERLARGVLGGRLAPHAADAPLAAGLDGLRRTPGVPAEPSDAALWICAADGPGEGGIVALEGVAGGTPPALASGAARTGRGPVTSLRPEGEEDRVPVGPLARDRPIRLLYIGGARRSPDIQEEFIHWSPLVEPGGLVAVDVSRRERDTTAARRFLEDTLRGSRAFDLVLAGHGLLIVRKTSGAFL